MNDQLNLNTRVIAHRGASAYAPENTMMAFIKAAQLGVGWVEFDVQLAHDGTAIIFHDDTLDRTTNGTGLVNHHSYDFLRTLDAGAWFDPRFSGERIPTFLEAFSFLSSNNVAMNIEIKPMPGEELATVQEVLREIELCGATFDNNMLFSSFSLPTLQILRHTAPESPIGFLMHEWLPDWRAICDDLDAVTVNVNEALMTEERAIAIKQSGRKLLCYTVNDTARAQTLYSYGVDALFSDTPDLILQV